MGGRERERETDGRTGKQTNWLHVDLFYAETSADRINYC